MKTLHKRGAGLDVLEREVVACLRPAIRATRCVGLRRRRRGSSSLRIGWSRPSARMWRWQRAFWKPVWHMLACDLSPENSSKKG